MFYSITLYASLAIFGIGLVYKISTWFRHKIGQEARSISVSTRAFAAIRGIVSTLLSAKIFVLLRVFVLDVVLQIFLLKKDLLERERKNGTVLSRRMKPFTRKYVIVIIRWQLMSRNAGWW